MKNLIKLMNKNILPINFFILFIICIFYYFNFERFDKYKSYVEFIFEERNVFIQDPSPSNFNFLDHFLSGIVFASNEINNPKDYSTDVDIKKKTITFIFSQKRNIFRDDSKHEYILTNKTDKIIDKLLVNYHIDLEMLVDKKIDQLSNIKKDEMNKEISINALNWIEYKNLLSNDKKVIKVKGYNVKYRRIFLNTDEYVISFIIFFLIFNFVIKNYFKIIK